MSCVANSVLPCCGCVPSPLLIRSDFTVIVFVFAMTLLPSHHSLCCAATLCSGLLRKVPAFRLCSAAFIRSIVVKLTAQVCLAGDYVVREGEIARSMFFSEPECTLLLHY